MSRLMDEKSWAIKNSGSVLAFETAGGHWEAWDRYLTIEGKKAFHIGNICGTCEFFFERLEGASQGVSPGEVSSTLEGGVSQLDEDLLSKVSSILPDGNYTVSLMEVNPRLVAPGTEEYGEFLQGESLYESNVDLGEDAKLLTLISCNYTHNDGRLYIHAVEVNG